MHVYMVIFEYSLITLFHKNNPFTWIFNKLKYMFFLEIEFYHDDTAYIFNAVHLEIYPCMTIFIRFLLNLTLYKFSWKLKCFVTILTFSCNLHVLIIPSSDPLLQILHSLLINFIRTVSIKWDELNKWAPWEFGKALNLQWHWVTIMWYLIELSS